jgi:hypothetical protein
VTRSRRPQAAQLDGCHPPLARFRPDEPRYLLGGAVEAEQISRGCGNPSRSVDDLLDLLCLRYGMDDAVEMIRAVATS